MTDPRTWSPGKKALSLAGVFVVALVLLQVLENLADRPSRPVRNASGADEMREPVRPTIVRVDNWTIEIRENRRARTTFRLDENDGLEEADALYTCLEQGVAREFDNNPTSSRSEMRSRLRKIESDCSPVVLPPLPTH
jgi:hypothetical protein